MSRTTPEPLNLAHVRRLTDGTGMLQHAGHTVPNYDEGYCTDDNARALVLCTLLESAGEGDRGEIHDLGTRYLAFLNHAYNEQNGRFRNFLSFDRRWLEEAGSEDSHARALWALGAVAARSDHDGLQGSAAALFERALPAADAFVAPRAWAFTLLGTSEFLALKGRNGAVDGIHDRLRGRLHDLLRQNRTPDWRWFEPRLTYANARMAEALLVAADADGDEVASDALEALAWLMEIQTPEGTHFVPIGNEGFYPRGGRRARFDQQPIEAASSVAACLAALRRSGDRRWDERANVAFAWYLGENDLGRPLVDPATGGCRDGLMPAGLNANQGAESTLAYLMSAAELQSAHIA